jgi:hypothetical protein
MGSKDNHRRSTWRKHHENFRDEMDAVVPQALILSESLKVLAGIRGKPNGLTDETYRRQVEAVKDVARIMKRYMSDIGQVLDDIIGEET